MAKWLKIQSSTASEHKSHYTDRLRLKRTTSDLEDLNRLSKIIINCKLIRATRLEHIDLYETMNCYYDIHYQNEVIFTYKPIFSDWAHSYARHWYHYVGYLRINKMSSKAFGG